MKPTLNEEIGMSQEGIDYVNSLEVKKPIYHPTPNYPKGGVINKKVGEFIPDTEYEKQRIKKQSQKVWAYVFVAIVIIVTYFLNR